jgi:hypothetical protein
MKIETKFRQQEHETPFPPVCVIKNHSQEDSPDRVPFTLTPFLPCEKAIKPKSKTWTKKEK